MQCPGQDSRFWKPDAIYEARCPHCSREVEFFKDDTARTCPHCGHRFVNPELDFGCAAYCQFAEQCLGSLPEEVKELQQDMLKDKVGLEVRRYFKTDAKRIRHAMTVARHAEKIGREEGGNLGVILMAAYLHDVGTPETERKESSSAAGYQNLEGWPTARELLEKVGAGPDVIEEVADIVDHHHQPRQEETLNFKAVYDADRIACLEERQHTAPLEQEELVRTIGKDLLTESGKKLAREILLS